MTYGTLISTQTIGAGGAASIDFNSISGSFTDLVLVHSIRTSNAGNHDDIGMIFNGSTTGYTSGRYLTGNGSTAGAGNAPSASLLYVGAASAAGDTSNTFGSNLIYIPNYAVAMNKSVLTDGVNENNASTSYQFIIAGLWSNTATITSISLKPYGGSGTIQQYSTASLYGIK